MGRNKIPVKAGVNGRNQPVKAYNMAVLDEDSAEINMYGDVVSIVPKDWRNGERLPGYIGLDEFLEDLEEIKEKNRITVHINSGGGDLYAGLAIYNRLKAVKGTVTTINDGMAASAAGLIFQAGDIRQMNAGSNFMAHGVAGFLFGYYDISDLKEIVTEFKAHNKAIVNVYAEAMGVSYEEARHFIEGETWLTGQEAVDKGLADEVISTEEEEGDEEGLFNRFLRRVQAVYGMPAASTAIPAAVPPIANRIKESETGGTEEMAVNSIEDLKNAYPEFVAQLERAAREDAQKQGVEAERARIRAIEEIESSIADKNLINDAKYGENPLTVEQLALKAMRVQAQIGANMLKNLEGDAAASGASAVNADPKGTEGGETAEEKEEQEAKDMIALYKGLKKGGAKE